jgi:hypothetical protein
VVALPEELDRLRENYLQLLALVSSDPPQLTAEEAEEEIEQFTVSDQEGMIWFMGTDGYFYSRDPHTGEEEVRNPEDFISLRGGMGGMGNYATDRDEDELYSYQFSHRRGEEGSENLFSSDTPASALDTDDWAAGIAAILPPTHDNGGLMPNDFGMSSPHFEDVRLDKPKTKTKKKISKKEVPTRNSSIEETSPREKGISYAFSEDHSSDDNDYDHDDDDIYNDEEIDDIYGEGPVGDSGIDLSFGQSMEGNDGPPSGKGKRTLKGLGPSQRKIIVIGGLAVLVVVLLVTNGGAAKAKPPAKSSSSTTISSVSTTIKSLPGAAIAPPQSYISTVIKSLLNPQTSQSVLAVTATPAQLQSTSATLNGYLTQGLEIAFGPFHYSGLTSGTEIWTLKSGQVVVGRANVSWTYVNGVWLLTALPNFSSV